MPTGIPLTRIQIQGLRNKASLHSAARARVFQLEEENEELKRSNEELRAENEVLKKKLEEQEDANKKLRTMLFVKQHGKMRMKRAHEKQRRTRESYMRTIPTKITEHKELLLSSCPDCGTDVGSPVSSRTRIIEDIVFQPEPNVTAWTIHRHWCAACGKQVAGSIPGILPKTRIGPNTLTFVVLSKYRWNQPYEKIQDQLQTCFGLHVSQGEIALLIERTATLVGDKWNEIVQAVKEGKIVHCDETGWHINGKKVWAHTFANDYAVLYEISSTRGKKIAENQLQGFTGTRITDCLPNYKNLSGNHQICWAHITREANENMQREQDNKERALLSQELDAMYKDLRSATKRTPWSEKYATRIHARCRKRLKNLLSQEWNDPACQKLGTVNSECVSVKR